MLGLWKWLGKYSSGQAGLVLIGSRANKIDSFMPWLLLTLSLPFMLFKQYVNVIQLVEASRWLAWGDAEMRRKARLLRAKTE